MVNFLTLDIFQNIILPFLLVFTLIFAILEKSNLLGKDKHQINAIMGFVIAGLLVGVYKYVDMIHQFVIFLVIALVILFVFLMISGFAFGTTDGDVFKNYTWAKWVLTAIGFIALVIAVLVITKTWDKFLNFITNSNVGTNIIFAIIIIAALAAVLFGGKKANS